MKLVSKLVSAFVASTLAASCDAPVDQAQTAPRPDFGSATGPDDDDHGRGGY